MAMMQTISRSWEFAKLSYAIIWDHKKLIIFPIVSAVAMVLVLASFILPALGLGVFEQASTVVAEDGTETVSTATQVLWGVLTFAFYFCNYFVIAFFNAALLFCAFEVIDGNEPSLSKGFALASRRLPQILGWSLVGATISTILKALESNEKIAAVVATVLGSAWAALTYFVVPVIVVEGKGPIGAIKGSLATLKNTWGTALVGNFSLGFLAFLIMLPFVLVTVGASIYFVVQEQFGLAITIGALGLTSLFIVGAFTSAADVVFKAVLYYYATGKSLPSDFDAYALDEAFTQKQSR